MRLRPLILLTIMFSVLVAATPAAAAGYRDLDGHWSASAARYVAETNDWMKVSGSMFRPGARLTRGALAVALVRAFPAPDRPEPPVGPGADPGDDPGPGTDPVPPPPPPPPTVFGWEIPSISFSDLPKSSSLYRYAAVAAGRGWVKPSGTRFRPKDGVTKAILERALVLALRDSRPEARLGEVIRGIDRISTSDGYRFKHTSWLAYQIIAKQLRFNYNYPGTSGRDPLPSTLITRADAAHALHAAATAGWRLWSLRRYTDIVLPPLSPARRKVVEFGLKYMGHPYVYAASSSRGFDCSGWVWWTLRRGSGPSSRPYAGWSIPQRSSYEMARATPTRVPFSHLRPLDLLFWDYEGEFKRDWRGVGHTGFYLGNGWMMHTSGGRGGATIDWMGDGHYKERLVWGRRVVPNSV